MFPTSIIYIQVNSGHVVARSLGGAGSVRKECAALSHPRTLMGDYQAVESLFRHVVKELSSGGLFRSSPKLVVHLIPDAEGGYTDVEERAFLEAATSAGARICKIVTGGSALSDSQVTAALGVR